MLAGDETREREAWLVVAGSASGVGGDIGGGWQEERRKEFGWQGLQTANNEHERAVPAPLATRSQPRT